MRRFKLDRKGFTLIELLAVITILGILMLILIPSVSRIIENSRKNTFLSTAKNYANAVRDAWSGDQLYCLASSGTDTNPHLASSLSTGTFVVMVASDTTAANYTYTSTNDYATLANANQNFKQLINSGGRSAWGNNEVYGYIKVVVTTTSVTVAGNTENSQLYDYYVELIDSQGHGLQMGTTKIDSVIRQSVLTAGATKTDPSGSPLYYCLVS